eukprot:6879127-Ditylum_brightwellii.AAC.1
MQLLNAAAGYPVPSTWMNAIKRGYYLTWPGLPAENACKYFPKFPITSRGHIKQKRKTYN